MAVPHVLATLPTGNASLSLLDDNFNYLTGSPVLTGSLGVGAGAVGSPAIYTNAHATTGFYEVASGEWGWASGGSQILDFASTGFTVLGKLTVTRTLAQAQFNYDGSTSLIITVESNGKVDYGAAGSSPKHNFQQAILLAASTTALATLNIPSGTAPTSPTDGDMWYDGTNVKFRVGGSTKAFTLT